MFYEKIFSVINGLIDVYLNKEIQNVVGYLIIHDLESVKERIQEVYDFDYNFVYIFLKQEIEKLRSIKSQLVKCIEDSSKLKSEIDYKKINTLTEDLQGELKRINLILNNYSTKKNALYNTEDYYTNKITELESKKKELENNLTQQKKIQGEKAEANAEINAEINKNLLEAKIKAYEFELEEKRKKENVIVEWKSKITSTFSELEKYLGPIKKEHTRLNRTYIVYSVLIAFVIVAIFVIEIHVFCEYYDCRYVFEFKNYVGALIPIPVLGALLWAFIIQANRAQRQLLILANHIHEISYVEGLLLSINNLSVDINDSAKRVNLAIERLLDNHLNTNSNSITEQGIIKEEKKDYVPIDTVLKLLKEIKGVVQK